MIKCSKCGAELSDDTKFCSYCGNKIEVPTPPPIEEYEEDDIPETPYREPVKATVEKSTAPKTLGDKIKAKGAEIWSQLSLYGKVATVATGVFVLLALVGFLAGKTAAGIIAILQIALVVVSILMHKGVIKLEPKKAWLKYLVLGVAILLTVLNIMSYSWGTKTPSSSQNPPSTNESSENNAEQIDWANITLSDVLPEPQSNMMEVLYNGEDWLNITVQDISENDFLEYVRLCKENKGFTVDSDSFDGYFYAFNQDGYCVTLFYDDSSKELNINLDAPDGDATENPNESTEGSTEVQQPTDTALSITKGTEYAYMTDEWNVYIATAISDDIIQIANWDKTMSNSKSVSHDYDVGTFKITDSENEFAWVDDEHTTFVITFTDKNNSDFKKGGTATFTINISDSDTNKGSNYLEEIACFAYENDDWHLYRAIPMTDTLIKIECWYRGSSAGKHLFGYDVCLIDTTRGDTDFEWTDDEHTSFSITMRDEQNKYEWKKDTWVVYILENEDYTHFDVKSYLGKWEVSEGEVAVPASASDYKYDNYQDVQKALEDAGFTNITTSIQYDIVWGWTDEGEVESVSIDGRTDYEKGEVFKQDAPIVITYHMKEEDDPSYVPEESTDITLTMSEEDFKGMDYKEAETIFREMGFTKFEYETVDTEDASKTDGTICYIEITEVFIGDSDFVEGDKFASDSTVTFYSYKYEEPEAPSPVFYSTNTYEVAKEGNTGVFSYRERGGSYDIYWIIDFDEGYVYYFTDGNGESFCDRLKIDSGTLNDKITITYHDGGDTWSYNLHFKYVNHPETLIMVDQNGFDYEYSTTDLDDALALRATKNIKDY